MKKNKNRDESVELLRAGTVVKSLASSFGRGLRETRITAILGYIIASKPRPWLSLFGFEGEPLEVNIEYQHDFGRSDIRIKTTKGVGIIEAKLWGEDPFEQTKKYPAKWRILLTGSNITGRKNKEEGIYYTYINWITIKDKLLEISSGDNKNTKFVAEDMIKYMEEHRMVKKADSVEIYAREINEEMTLNMFLVARFYGCHFQRNSKISDASYFVPHFGQRIASNHPGVQVGFSYIARIEDVQIVSSWNEFLDTCKAVRSRHWLNKHMKLLVQAKDQWKWHENEFSIIFLGKPRLVFTPAIKKSSIQEGSGRFSKNYLTFDNLFEGWSK